MFFLVKWPRNGRILNDQYELEYDSQNHIMAKDEVDNNRIYRLSSDFTLSEDEAVPPRKRKHFPETWLWELVFVR